jgi:hypothetical protein
MVLLLKKEIAPDSTDVPDDICAYLPIRFSIRHFFWGSTFPDLHDIIVWRRFIGHMLDNDKLSRPLRARLNGVAGCARWQAWLAALAAA